MGAIEEASTEVTVPAPQPWRTVAADDGGPGVPAGSSDRTFGADVTEPGGTDLEHPGI